MPTYSAVQEEINAALATHGNAAFDFVRRKYLAAVSAHTGRNTILYATKWTQAAAAPPTLISITREDIQGLMEVVHGLETGTPLDIIVHSPGGEPEATEAIVDYLRAKFSDIRVIVPHAAMSAATMLACAANSVVMGKHSSIGPIDPQFILQGPAGPMVVPAQAIVDQFELAKKECQDPKMLGAWLPMLGQYGPALLVQCHNALKMSEHLVAEWLRHWMLLDKYKGNKKRAAAQARKIARRLNDHGSFMSHGRHISRTEAEALGLVIVPLESDQTLQDNVLSLYHATSVLFDTTPIVKVIENQNGRFFGKLFRPQMPVRAQSPQSPQAGIA